MAEVVPRSLQRFGRYTAQWQFSISPISYYLYTKRV